MGRKARRSQLRGQPQPGTLRTLLSFPFHSCRQARNRGATALSVEQPDYREPPGHAAHWDQREDTDSFSQPGALFRLMTPAQQQLLFDNTARSLSGAPLQIQLRHIRHCLLADPAYGRGMAMALKIDALEEPHAS